MRIEYTCPSQSGCERLRIYRRACGKSRLWEKHVRPNTNGTVEGRLQGTRKIPLAKVGIPSAFRRREDVKELIWRRHILRLQSIYCSVHQQLRGRNLATARDPLYLSFRQDSTFHPSNPH